MNGISQYKDAVEAIKTAILQSQYEALKSVNRIQVSSILWCGKISVHQNTQRNLGNKRFKNNQQPITKRIARTERLFSYQFKEDAAIL